VAGVQVVGEIYGKKMWLGGTPHRLPFAAIWIKYGKFAQFLDFIFIDKIKIIEMFHYYSIILLVPPRGSWPPKRSWPPITFSRPEHAILTGLTFPWGRHYHRVGGGGGGGGGGDVGDYDDHYTQFFL